MTPYVDFLYFAILLYPIVPAVALGFLGRLRLWYVLLATGAMLLVQYGNPLGSGTEIQLAYLAGFTAYEVAIVLSFALFRRHRRRHAPYYAAVLLVLLPLVAVKVYPLLLAHGWLTGLRHALPRALPVQHIPKAPFTHPAARSLATPGTSTVPTAAPALVPGLVDTFGFLGISYMSFRVLDAVISLQDGLITFPSLGILLAYVLFFPCASAGPIDRYRRFAGDLARRRTAAEYALDIDAGIYRIAQGFLYKFILAQIIYTRWLALFSHGRDPVHMLAYMYGYTFYLFFDFAGYSAFAIGVSRFFGIHTPENFRAPFWSHNFREFWNRWFITLSWFLRDHIYMRFVLGATRRKWFKNRYVASYIGYLLTMGAMGFWHGLQLHYIVYGLYQGIMLIVHDFLARYNGRRKLIADGPLARLGSVVLTFNLVCFGMLIFSGHLFR